MDESDYPEAQPAEQEESALDHFPEEVIEEYDGEQRTIKIESMIAMVARMGVSDKIKLALIGNKEARGLLIKENNRVVVKNVIENPRLTDDEVISFVGNKNLSAEVTRLVSTKKQYMKSYRVRCALVRNPKSPIPQVMKIMPGLPDHELKELAHNPGVTGVVKITARRILSQRGKA